MEQRRFRNSLPSRRAGEWRTPLSRQRPQESATAGRSGAEHQTARLTMKMKAALR